MSHNLASGVISAAVLPFDDSGAIDWKTLERYIIQVAAGDPRAIAMNMAVSEVSSLEVAEQLEVLRRCKATLAGGCTLLSGLNVTHTGAAVDHARRLIDAGAEGLVVFPPVPAFLSAPSVAMIVDYHAAVAEAVGVPLHRLPDQLLQLSEGHDQRAVADPRHRLDQGCVVQRRADARQRQGSQRREAQDRRADRKRHLHPRSHADGVRRRADRLRGNRHRRARAHARLRDRRARSPKPTRSGVSSRRSRASAGASRSATIASAPNTR